jgi:hypothetical protein
VPGFADQVDDGPVILPSLNIADLQGYDLRSTQATAEEERDDRCIALLTNGLRSGSREECFTFCDSEPVSNAPAKLRQALDTPDARDQFWAQQPGIGCLIRQPPDGSEPDVDC